MGGWSEAQRRSGCAGIVTEFAAIRQPHAYLPLQAA